jgi:hypothetical protein
VSAPEIETFVAGEIRRLGQDRDLLAAELKQVQPLLTAAEAADLTAAFERLDATWDTLSLQEQTRDMHRVVEKAVCDVEAGKAAITLSLNGVMVAMEKTDGDDEARQWATAGSLVIERETRFGRARKATDAQSLPTGRIPRISRIMALAIKFDGLVQDGTVVDYADIARLGCVTRARVTQIMNLLHLAPDLQEEMLFLPRVAHGRDPITAAQDVGGTENRAMRMKPGGAESHSPAFFSLSRNAPLRTCATRSAVSRCWKPPLPLRAAKSRRFRSSFRAWS